MWQRRKVVWHLSIQLIIVCVYIALLFGISFYVKRRADKGSTEYLFAGRKLSAGLIAVNITGLAVGAASTVGVAENAFKVGMAAGWYNAAWAAGAVVMGLVAAGKLRAMKISTIPEFFEKYYDTKGRVISAVGLVIIMSVITALQYLAGGAILASLLPDIFSFKGGMMMSAVVFIGITLIGGLWSSGLSNIVSVCLIYVGVLYSCFAAVNNAGGIENIAAQLPPTLDWFDPLAGIPMAVIIGWRHFDFPDRIFMRAARHCSEGFFPGYYGDYGSAESRYESEPGGIRNDAGCLVGGRCFYCLHDPFGGGHFVQSGYLQTFY